MELNTPAAIREIKAHKSQSILVDGKSQCPLQAMAFAMNYHKLDITETNQGLSIKGTVPVVRNNRFVLKKVRDNIGL